MASMKYTSPRMIKQLHDLEYAFYLSGHIPGSCSLFLKHHGQTLLYTSDINCIDTQLMKKCDDMPHADIMISECTYGQREHVNRNEVENKFLDKIRETLQRGGSV